MIDFQQFRSVSDEELSEHVYHMQTRGFSIFPDFLNEETCDILKDKLLNAVLEYKPQGSERSVLDKYLLHDLICHNLIFGRLLEDPRLQKIVASILDEYWIMYAYTSSSLPPQGTNYGSRIHVDSPRFIPNYATNVGILWAIDNFTLENGGTHLLPGSHNSNLIPSPDLFEKNAVRITCKKGTALIFNARVWHRAGENKTDSWRHSLTMNVCRPYMKQRMDWVRLVPQEISDQLNNQARRIIGFDTRLPTSMEEFFVNDDKRLYKSNQE